MIVLTKHKAARLLECICIQRKCTPQSILSNLPYRVCDNIVLVRIGRMYCLSTITPPLPDATIYPYAISVDGNALFSQASGFNAVKLAEQLCDVYPLARRIEIHHNGALLFKWKRIAIGQWINR